MRASVLHDINETKLFAARYGTRRLIFQKKCTKVQWFWYEHAWFAMNSLSIVKLLFQPRPFWSCGSDARRSFSGSGISTRRRKRRTKSDRSTSRAWRHSGTFRVRLHYLTKTCDVRLMTVWSMWIMGLDPSRQNQEGGSRVGDFVWRDPNS